MKTSVAETHPIEYVLVKRYTSILCEQDFARVIQSKGDQADFYLLSDRLSMAAGSKFCFSGPDAASI
jgi:hypothetical protein